MWVVWVYECILRHPFHILADNSCVISRNQRPQQNTRGMGDKMKVSLSSRHYFSLLSASFFFAVTHNLPVQQCPWWWWAEQHHTACSPCQTTAAWSSHSLNPQAFPGVQSPPPVYTDASSFCGTFSSQSGLYVLLWEKQDYEGEHLIFPSSQTEYKNMFKKCIKEDSCRERVEVSRCKAFTSSRLLY